MSRNTNSKKAKGEKSKRSSNEKNTRSVKKTGSGASKPAGSVKPSGGLAAIAGRIKETVHLIRTSSRFRHGTMATVMTVVFFVFIVLLNIAVLRMKDRYTFMSVDMTDDQRYTLTDETKKIIMGIDEHVEIDILATEAQCTTAGVLTDDPYGQIPIAHEIIRRYPQLNSNISINYVDISKMPAYVLQFPEYSNMLDYYSVVIKSARRTRVTSFFDMLPSLSSGYTSYDSTTQTSSFAQSYTETYMTSLIKTVTLDKTPKVAFIDGLNVDGGSADFIKILNLNGYDVEVYDIRKDTIPEDTDIVMIASPKTDLKLAEVEKLDRYLASTSQQHTIVLFVTSQMPELPNLNNLLGEYGISLTRDIVYEGDSHHTISVNQSDFTAQMMESDYTLGLIDSMTYPAVSSAVSLNLVYREKGDTNVYAVLTSSDDAFVCDSSTVFDRSGYTQADKDTRVIMAASTTFRDRMDGGEVRTDIIVAPDSLYASEFITTDIYGNLSLLMNIFNQRGGIDGDNVDIEPKSLYAVDFSIDMGTLSVMSAIFGYVIPVIALAGGLVVYIRRRRL